MITLETYHSGRYEQASGLGYKYFLPSNINDEWVWQTPEINFLLEKAARKLGELNSFSKLVPSIDLFLQMYVAKEAVISSRIEGTQTNIDEAFFPEMEIPGERRDDWHEVNNYINALNFAIQQMGALPLSSRLLRQAHAVLLSGVRGETKQPGEFRKSQNWIGGNTLRDAVFIPPHFQFIDALMGDLENFLHNDQISTPALVRIAIGHYQFETIHPFLDGNGRIGRLMIPLFLVSEGVLDKPLLFMSHFFEMNKGLYYDNLTRVRSYHDMTQWFKYFLVGIEETASQAVEVLVKVLALKERLELLIHQSMGRKGPKALVLLRQLFQRPVLDIKDVAEGCEVSFKTASEMVKNFIDLKILNEVTGQSRNRLFVFQTYLDVFGDKKSE